MAIAQGAAALVAYAARCAIIRPEDRTWAYNRILGALRLSGPTPTWDAVDVEEFDLEAVMALLGAAGVAAGIDEDTPLADARAQLEAEQVKAGAQAMLEQARAEKKRLDATAQDTLTRAITSLTGLRSSLSSEGGNPEDGDE